MFLFVFSVPGACIEAAKSFVIIFIVGVHPGFKIIMIAPDIDVIHCISPLKIKEGTLPRGKAPLLFVNNKKGVNEP